MSEELSIANVADLLSVSKETIRRWDRSGKLKANRKPNSNYRYFYKEDLKQFEQLAFLFNDRKKNEVKPLKNYGVVELFAGAGGMALGWEKAGLKTIVLNDFDKY